MKSLLMLLAVFVAVRMDAQMTQSQLSKGEPSFQGVAQAVPKQISQMELPFSNKPRILTDDEQQQQKRALQNEAVFKRLRGGLMNAEVRQKNRQRFSKNLKPQQQLVNRLNGQSFARAQSDQHAPAVDQETLLKQAGLIEQEVITSETDKKPPQKTYSDLQIALYLAIAIMLTICLIKFIRQRWLSTQASIPTPHEETESLSTM